MIPNLRCEEEELHANRIKDSRLHLCLCPASDRLLFLFFILIPPLIESDGIVMELLILLFIFMAHLIPLS